MIWSTSPEEVLPGADLVSFSLMALSGEVFGLSELACSRHGFMGLADGKIALEGAQAMEKHCPEA